MHRPIQVVIPFKHDGAKSRLAPALSPEGRCLLARSMLGDVLDAVSGIGPVMILSKPGVEIEGLGAEIEVRESPLDLNDALNELLVEHQNNGWPSDVLIIMADLALVTSEDVLGMVEGEGDIILCPGRGGGTNAILVRDPRFRTWYTGLSFPKHLDACGRLGLQAQVYYSYRMGCDIDEPEDLAEVLLHNRGGTRKLLESIGFKLSEREEQSA